jgi:hypothetical protein
MTGQLVTGQGGSGNAVVQIQPGMQVQPVCLVDESGNPVTPGGGSGTVTSVTATDPSIVVSGTDTVAPTIATGTLDVVAAQHPPAASWSNNDQAITGDGAEMICLTMNEIRRMHALLCRSAHPPGHHLHWSAWRCRHQARARRSHYRQAALAMRDSAKLSGWSRYAPPPQPMSPQWPP